MANQDRNKPLKNLAVTIFILLILQYILGMITNLFVSFPQNKNIGQMWAFARVQIPLLLHMFLGIGLFITALVLLVKAIRRKNKQWIIVAGLSDLSILIAIVAGIQFVPTQTALYSFIMAMSFIVAFASIAYGLYISRAE